MATFKNTTVSGNGLILPVGTTAERSGSPALGNMRINTDKGGFLEVYNNANAWDNNSSWVVTAGYRTTPSFTPRLLIQAESVGLNNLDIGRRTFVQVDGTTIVNVNTPRSYQITKLVKNTSTGQWTLGASNGYDVYGSATSATDANNFLNTFNNGEMLILTTYDEPNTRRTTISENLRDNFASNIYGYQWQWNSRDMHLLISFRDATAPLFEDHHPSPEGGISASIWLP